MRIYLDVCCLQRPLDDRSQLRINLEAEAILAVLRLVELGQVELLSSEVIELEINHIPDRERQEKVVEITKLATQVIELDDEIETQGDAFVKAGIKPLDALHLASASVAKADYFCTCDDRLLKRSQGIKGLDTAVVSPAGVSTEGDTMTVEIRPLVEVNQQATNILVREMGIVDTLRFLGQFRAGSGDYTKERGQWLDDLSLEQITAAIKAKRQKHS